MSKTRGKEKWALNFTHGHLEHISVRFGTVHSVVCGCSWPYNSQMMQAEIVKAIWVTSTISNLHNVREMYGWTGIFFSRINSLNLTTKHFTSTTFHLSGPDWPQLRLGVSYGPTQTCAHRRSHHIVQGQNSASCHGGQRNPPAPQHWASADTVAPWYGQKSAPSEAQSAVQSEIKQMWMNTRFWVSFSCQNSEENVRRGSGLSSIRFYV